MTDSTLTSHHGHPKQVPFQERAFPMGNVVGVNAFRISRASLKHRIAEGGYQVHETPHFLVGMQAKTPTLVVHWFSPEAIDADLGQHFIEELKPLGMLEQPQNFGDVFGAVVGSVSPKDPQRAWHLFGTNTLQRYRHLLTTDTSSPHYDSPVDVFATLYRRVCELHVGDSLLDAGCSFGLLPLFVAESIPALTKVVGVDIRTDSFPVTRAIADERHLTNVQFLQADLLVDDLSTIGQFDLVTVLHVLEHFTEDDMYRVLTNLLKVTSHRLIIGVPYEPGEPETAYGHEQLFTRAKLEAVGHWCLEQLGTGYMSCEDCAGGLLIIDIHPS
ncbi:MAG: class I SAM-dependent methyltransferase [Ktedonobacteraceae bacterium]